MYIQFTNNRKTFRWAGWKKKEFTKNDKNIKTLNYFLNFWFFGKKRNRNFFLNPEKHKY